MAVGVLVNYLDRLSISVAAPKLQEELHLTPVQIGLLLSAFFWSYSLAQLPSGMLLDRFGVTRVGRVGAFLWTLASTLTALGVDTVVMGGFSTSGCVRASALDALQHGFIPFVVREASGDRDARVQEANLFDLQAKYAEVVSENEALTLIAGAASA